MTRDIIRIGNPDPINQFRAMPPSPGMNPRDVEEFPGRAIRLGGIEYKLAGKPDNVLDDFRKLPDRQVLAASYIDQGWGARLREHSVKRSIGQPHQEDTRIRQVVCDEELAPSCSGSPNGNLIVGANLGLVHLSNQRWQHMGSLQVIVVPQPVEIRRHYGNELRAELPVIGTAHLDSGDLCNGIRAVCRLQRPGQKIFLPDGLRAITWVNAARSQED